MTEVVETADLFALPPDEVGLLPGTIDGPPDWREGFGAGLRVWTASCGWLQLGEVITTTSVVVFHEGRLSVGITFDLGPHKNPRWSKAGREARAAAEAAADGAA
jgi:hypothetical protein